MSSVSGTRGPLAMVGLLRLGNCVMGALGALLAALICAGPELLLDYAVEVVLSMAIVVLFTGAGNALNDYFDREVDRVNRPDRPLPSGRVTVAELRALFLAFSAAGQSSASGPVRAAAEIEPNTSFRNSRRVNVVMVALSRPGAEKARAARGAGRRPTL